MLRKLAFGIFLLLTALSIIFALRDGKTVTTKSSEAYQHYLVGVDLCEKIYYRQAAKEFEQAVALDSGFAMAEAQLAKAYMVLGFGEKQKEMWELAKANRSKVSEREKLLLDMWAAEEGDSPALADSLAQKFVADYPEQREGYVSLANREFARENWERSIELNQKILKIDPNYANAYNMLGYLNYYLGRYDEALASLEKYIQLCPNQANPRDSRGEILYARGQYENALREFREAFNINPELDFPVLHMAATYAVLGELKQMDYCFQTLATQPGNPLTKYNYLIQQARLYVDCRKFDEAGEILNRVISEDPDSEKTNTANAVATKGWLAYNMRDADGLKSAWSQRRQYLEQLVEKWPATAQRAGLTRTYPFLNATEADLAGNLENAAKQFSESFVSTHNPSEQVTMRTMYANVLWRKGDVDLARSELQKNLSANSNHPKSLTLLADIADAEQNEDLAADYRRRALAVWKNADADYMPLAELQKKMGASLVLIGRSSSSRP
ncbi:MAG: tetratricopeptide repeat protein [Candidatus Zixiibacteriota bacterium]|nr:MAG: tetratricopeptide repeat protein [candidate division Zixibacteria bacterium]